MATDKKEIADEVRASQLKAKDENKRKKEEENKRQRQEEKAWKETEKLSKQQADKEKKEAETRAREQQKARKEAEKRINEEASREAMAEERAWKEAEQLSKLQAEKELKEENERRKKREQLVKKLGIQKPGLYVIRIESQNTELINGIESRLKKIPGLKINISSGSLDGIQFGISLEQEADILLKLTDLTQIAMVNLKHNIIRVQLK